MTGLLGTFNLKMKSDDLTEGKSFIYFFIFRYESSYIMQIKTCTKNKNK